MPPKQKQLNPEEAIARWRIQDAKIQQLEAAIAVQKIDEYKVSSAAGHTRTRPINVEL